MLQNCVEFLQQKKRQLGCQLTREKKKWTPLPLVQQKSVVAVLVTVDSQAASSTSVCTAAKPNEKH